VRHQRTIVLVAFLGVVAARSATAAEGEPEQLRGGEHCCASSLMCQYEAVADDADETMESAMQPVEVRWQSPPPADLSCEDELFSSAVGMCDGAMVDQDKAPPARPPLSCDGVSCFPDDAPLPPARPLYSSSHPVALAARWRAPALASETLPAQTRKPLAPGFPRRLDRPPKTGTGST
jgi:hypothetical protein